MSRARDTVELLRSTVVNADIGKSVLSPTGDGSQLTGISFLGDSTPQLNDKNLIINGRLGTDTMINQREFASGTLKKNVYGFDRWMSRDGDTVLTLNESDVTLVSGKLAQIIEDPYLLGEQITVSAQVNSGTLTGRIGAVGSFQELPFTVSAPSGNIRLELVGDGAQFTNVKVQRGSVATECQHLSYRETLTICQEFYLRITGGGASNAAVCLAANWSGTSYHAVIPFPVTMRASPKGSASGNDILNLIGSGVQRLSSKIGFMDNQTSSIAAEIYIIAAGETAACVWARFRRKADWIAWSAEL